SPALSGGQIFIRSDRYLSCIGAGKPKVEGPSVEEFQGQINRLKPGSTKSAMFEALKGMRGNEKAPNAGSVLPGLEKFIPNEDDARTRNQAVYTLAVIALAHKRPCPVLLIKCIQDEDEQVRQTAGCFADQFRSFEPGSLEILLRCVESPTEQIRDSALMVLAYAGGKDKRVLAALEKAKADKSFGIRHNANAALFTAS